MNLSKVLGLKYPLIVAPMAGGPTTPELVVASSEAGALGFLGAAYLSATDIKSTATKIREQTKKPFGINLFIPSRLERVSVESVSLAIQTTEKFRNELKLPMPKLEAPFEEDFDAQFDAVLAVKPNVLSFVFGLLSENYLKEARKASLFVVGTATSADEALKLQESGVDAVIAQGFEAGGHRGIFDAKAEDPGTPTLELVRQIKSKLKIPVIAAGGIMTSNDIQRTLREGADAVQMGTAFLATREAGTSAPFRKKLLEASIRKTKTTRAFSGRFARGIVNRFMQELDSKPNSILPFPAQNKFTRDLRKASSESGSADFLSLWCGSGNGELWTGSASELVEKLFS